MGLENEEYCGCAVESSGVLLEVVRDRRVGDRARKMREVFGLGAQRHHIAAVSKGEVGLAHEGVAEGARGVNDRERFAERGCAHGRNLSSRWRREGEAPECGARGSHGEPWNSSAFESQS